MRSLRRVALVLAWACCAASAVAQVRGAAVTVHWSAEVAERPEFRGVLNKDRAGLGPGHMLYPGGAGLAGLLVGVLTHAAVSSSAQSAEMKRLQAEADAVLQPYQAALQTLSSAELLTLTQRALAQGGIAEGQGRASLALHPVFMMTQDRQALLLDVIAQFGDGSGATAGTLGMRVVSAPRGAVQEADDWARPDGSGLRRVCVSLLTRAVQHLLDHLGSPRPADPNASARSARTVRYSEGGTQRMERATVLEQHCGRALLLTLSNTLMSVPLSRPTAHEAGCEAASAADPAALSASPPATVGTLTAQPDNP